MTRAAILACWPWLATLIVLVLLLRLLARVSLARWEWRRLGRLHADQQGSVQTLSFVLTLPLFIMVMMLIVQVSQLMIGMVVVEYAAFAAARAAVVWIPANLGFRAGDPPKVSRIYDPTIGAYTTVSMDNGYGDPLAPENVFLPYSPFPDDYTQPQDGSQTYTFTLPEASDHSNLKFEQIRQAAVLACMPICPSRDGAASSDPASAATGAAIQAAYASMVPSSASNTRIPQRLLNKLWYAQANTKVAEIRFDHKYKDAPLVWHTLMSDGNPLHREPPTNIKMFHPPNQGDVPTAAPTVAAPYEIGWQEPITVTVTHDLALLPGPGRLLAKAVTGPSVPVDTVAQTIQSQATTIYTYPLKAEATLSNEGEKAVVYYVEQLQ